jgi:signal transduction histidine kinase
MTSDPNRSTTDALPDGVVVFSPEWRVLLVNRAAERMLQVPREELEGKVLGRDLLYLHQMHVSVFQDVLRDGQPRALGEIHWVDPELGPRTVIGEARRTEAGGIAVVYREALPREKTDPATAAAVPDVLAGMAHEIRTPVHAILGYAELLHLGTAGPLTPEQSAYLSRLEASTRHLLRLMEELLDFGRAAAGHIPLLLVPGRAAAVVSAAVEVMRADAEARGVEIAHECDNPEVTYFGDEDRVRQILLNLLANAIKFTDRGGRIVVGCGAVSTPDPRSRLLGSGPWVCMSVHDTGIGIALDELQTIFEPYVQATRGRPRERGGAGLGLALSRQLARAMGGDVTAESTLGVGSTFTLWLPQAESHSSN